MDEAAILKGNDTNNVDENQVEVDDIDAETGDETSADENQVEIDIDAIDLTLKQQVTASIESIIQSLPSPRCCIHKVPQEFCAKKEDLYVPHTVSIGPFHHGNPRLKAMEDHKKGYLQAFLHRSDGRVKIEDLVNAIWDMEADARECYSVPFNDITKEKFVEIMLLDGCFILELFHRFKEETNTPRNLYDDDRMFIARWLLPSCRQDLILAENQLPYTILEALHDCIITNVRDESSSSSESESEDSLVELVAMFFDPIFPTEAQIETTSSNAKTLHLLDFLRSHLFPNSPDDVETDKVAVEYTKCATHLSEAGVKFRKKKKPNGLLDITFSKRGVLQIPPFLFGRSMAVLLANLIAFEQCHGYAERVTSYGVLLDSLISSPNDVKLLRGKQIIDCFFYEDEMVSSSINSLCKRVSLRRFYYEGLCHRVNKYCRKKQHRWRATLKHDYFKSPWAIISVIAAVILLLLTIAQTVASYLDL